MKKYCVVYDDTHCLFVKIFIAKNKKEIKEKLCKYFNWNYEYYYYLLEDKNLIIKDISEDKDKRVVYNLW